MIRLTKGFSLVELMVVMAVLGVLATAAMPLAEVVRRREQERELRQALWEIRAAIDAYKVLRLESGLPREGADSGYPTSLKALVQGVPRRGGGVAYVLRRVPRDPFAADEVADDATWGLRSFDSPPDKPRAGSDVYDVYSMSRRIGLNGIPLRQW